jgi:hypothetical protein
MPQVFDTIRDALPICGKRVIEVTCDDEYESCPIALSFGSGTTDAEGRVQGLYIPPSSKRVFLHFDDGTTLTFWTDAARGFEYDGLPGPPTDGQIADLGMGAA